MREERLTLARVFGSFRVGHLVLLFLSREVEHHRQNGVITFSFTLLWERKRGRGKEGGKKGGESKWIERVQSMSLVTHFL